MLIDTSTPATTAQGLLDFFTAHPDRLTMDRYRSDEQPPWIDGDLTGGKACIATWLYLSEGHKWFEEGWTDTADALVADLLFEGDEDAASALIHNTDNWAAKEVLRRLAAGKHLGATEIRALMYGD